MKFERLARKKGFQSIAGIDEAGRGPLAGPVVAAACILPKNLLIPGINDSKLLTPKKRQEIFQQLTTHSAIDYGVGIMGVEVIDKINILQATIEAMKTAISKLKNRPDYLLVDAVSLNLEGIFCEPLIKGDQRSQSIAAASIIAKETRDALMREYHLQHPEYGFEDHKGYGTPDHLEALNRFGPCPIHRRSFEPVKSLSLSLLETVVI